MARMAVVEAEVALAAAASGNEETVATGAVVDSVTGETAATEGDSVAVDLVSGAVIKGDLAAVDQVDSVAEHRAVVQVVDRDSRLNE